LLVEQHANHECKTIVMQQFVGIGFAGDVERFRSCAL